jgi:hypothetical protein
VRSRLHGVGPARNRSAACSVGHGPLQTRASLASASACAPLSFRAAVAFASSSTLPKTFLPPLGPSFDPSVQHAISRSQLGELHIGSAEALAMRLGSSLLSLGVLGLTLASCGDGNYRLGSGRGGSPAAIPGSSGQGGRGGVDVDGGTGSTGSVGVGATSTGGTGGDSNTGGSAGGSDVDATSNVPDVPDALEDRSSDASAGSGGSGGTSATSGSGGSAGADPNRWPGVKCMAQTCGPAEVCCVVTFPGYPNFPPADEFRCAAPGATCEYTSYCDGDHDCPAGQQCCVAQTAGGWVASCAASCASPPYHVECSHPEHCVDGLVCCGTNFQLNRFDSFLCRPSCNGLNDHLVCSVNEDCSSSAGCDDSTVLPGVKTCMPRSE